MTFQDFKDQIIIKPVDQTFGNQQDGFYNKVKLIMYYKPDMSTESWFSGWIGEKSFLVEDIKQMDINEPYKQVWMSLKDRINSYYFNNFCNKS